MVQLFYTIYISEGIAYHELFSAKFGKGGIKMFNQFKLNRISHSYQLDQSIYV